MKTVLALNKEIFGGIKYREVIAYEKGKAYLENINIILNDKIVKKLRYEIGEIPYKRFIGKELMSEYLLSVIVKNSKEETKKGRTKKNVNRKAHNKAAVNLMNELGL